MRGPLLQIGLNLLFAWAAGAAIGFERSYNGRAAGLRTHALVSLASASVLLISYAPLVAPGFPSPQRIDPTRLAQGVMTGVGFLGAGVIFKEGVSVQGLTTAAAIWSAAAVGLLFGLGMPGPGLMTLAGVMVTLTVMRWIEGVFPWRIYAMAVLRFRVGQSPSEPELRAMLNAHGAVLSDVSYKLCDGGETFEYRGGVETRRDQALRDLAARLRSEPGLIEYELDRISK